MAKTQTVEEQQSVQEEVQVKLVGLDHLDDETLARIVSDRDQNDEMTYEARLALQELARRSGHNIG